MTTAATNAQRLIQYAVVAGFAAVTLTGCGGSSSTGDSTSPASASSSASDDPSSSGSATPDACDALTAAQASAITGVKYTGATSSGQGSLCNYTSSVAPVPLHIAITEDSGGSAAWTSELANLKSTGGGTPVTVTGVGDRAASSGGTLGVQVGSRIIDITGGDPKSIALGKAIIAALQ